MSVSVTRVTVTALMENYVTVVRSECLNGAVHFMFYLSLWNVKSWPTVVIFIVLLSHSQHFCTDFQFIVI